MKDSLNFTVKAVVLSLIVVFFTWWFIGPDAFKKDYQDLVKQAKSGNMAAKELLEAMADYEKSALDKRAADLDAKTTRERLDGLIDSIAGKIKSAKKISNLLFTDFGREPLNNLQWRCSNI